MKSHCKFYPTYVMTQAQIQEKNDTFADLRLIDI